MQSLFDFIKNSLSINELPNHVKIIADRIEEKITSNITIPQLLMISMPPRSLKTTIISKNFPLWICKYFQSKTIGLSSYSNEIANINYNNVTLDNFFYKKNNHTIMPLGIGDMLCSCIFDIFIIDDYYKNDEQTTSKIYRKNVYKWFIHSFSKLNPNGLYIIISSRWDKNDLIGQILKEIKLRNICCLIDYLNFSAISEQKESSKITTNISFWPEKYPNNRLLEIKEQIGEKWWQSLYQGNPI